VFDIASGTEITRTFPNGQTAVAFGIDDRDLIVGNDAGFIEVRPVDAKEAIRLTGMPAARAVDFSPAGGYLAIGGAEGDVQIIDIDGWRKVISFKHAEPVVSMAFSADGRWLAVIGQHVANSHDTGSWAVRTHVAHEDEIEASGFSPDSRYLVTSTTRVLALSPLQDGGEPRIFEHDGELEPQVEFDRGSAHIRSRTKAEYNRRDGLTKAAAWSVWESASGKLLQTIPIRDDAEASDKETSAKEDWQSVTLALRPRVAPDKGPWPIRTTLQGADLLAEQLVQAARAHGANLTDHSVSADGAWVATVANDPTVRVWTLVPETLMAQMCSRLTRNLSEKEWAEFQVADEPNRPTCRGMN
jgi:WD40 repeat protein